MSRLDSLQDRLARLKQQKKNIEANLKKYRERKSDVEKIREKLIDVVDDNYGSINKIISEICDDVFSAIVGSAFGGHVNSSVTESKEKGSGSDGQIVTALNDLLAELRSINRKIDNLDNELDDVKRQIRNTEEEIRQERRRLAEEALKKAANLLGG